jgi:hypothetical protein
MKLVRHGKAPHILELVETDEDGMKIITRINTLREDVKVPSPKNDIRKYNGYVPRKGGRNNDRGQ